MDNLSNILKKLVPFCLIILLSCTLFPGHVFGLERHFRNSIGMEFVLIPAGSFIMGSPPGEPKRHKTEVQHKVKISRPFYMQTTEVTLKQWRSLMRRKFFGRRKGKSNAPVVRVSWHDCIKFIKRLNNLNEGTYRLPTEAEWEYTCRAGTKTAYSWGDSIDCSKALYNNSVLESGDCLDYVRSRGLDVNRPVPVKSYPPNGWGLYDMHGNVWEWCLDWYGDYSKGLTVDPSGPDSGTEKIRRGGSWFKHGYSCRSANRAHGHPPTRYKTTGFRVVREVR
jgi:formylglycine-generating enzyme required for sulfatase activity